MMCPFTAVSCSMNRSQLPSATSQRERAGHQRTSLSGRVKIGRPAATTPASHIVFDRSRENSHIVLIDLLK